MPSSFLAKNRVKISNPSFGPSILFHRNCGKAVRNYGEGSTKSLLFQLVAAFCTEERRAQKSLADNKFALIQKLRVGQTPLSSDRFLVSSR